MRDRSEPQTMPQPVTHVADHRGRILCGILLSKAAIATFSIAPFLIGQYIDRLGLSAAQASRALSAEILALAISNGAAFLWLRRVENVAPARVLLLLTIAANVSCIFTAGYAALLAQRVIVGALQGALLALGFRILGTTSRPERNFGLYFAVSLTIGALNVRALPLFLDAAGVAGLFINLSLYALIALAGTFLPRGRHDTPAATLAPKAHVSTQDSALRIAAVPLLLLLLANYLYFVGQGGVWSFLERLGRQFLLPLDSVANAVSLSLLAGVAGGMTAGWVDLRFGRMAPLFVAIGLATLSLFVFWTAPGAIAFAVGACLFNFGSNFGHPYILGLASKIDRSGRLTVLSGALHTAGQATGPFIVGLAVMPPDFSNALWLGLLMFVATTLLLAPAAVIEHDERAQLRSRCEKPSRTHSGTATPRKLV